MSIIREAFEETISEVLNEIDDITAENEARLPILR